MEKIIIDENGVGERFDRFLKEGFFLNGEITRGEIIREIKKGNILLNGKITKPSNLLKKTDEITIALKEKASQLLANPKAKFKIISQDKNIIVIDKPAGLSVHPTSFEDKTTLANGLLAKFPEIENINDGSAGSEFRPGIVHRLDKDTSGVMVVARNQKAFQALKKIFQERKADKKYLAIVAGHLPDKKGVIEKPLASSASHKKQIIAHRKTRTKIRPAVTEYVVLNEYERHSLVEVMPKTGRTHQIRIHLTSLGNPIVGDKIYKDKSVVPELLAKRQLLHAQSLAFELFGKKYQFAANPPKDFQDFLKYLTDKG
jgi:23S rRNA pseudouridine1911/1915/1917 synthase